MTIFIHYNLYFFWKLRKVKLYYNTCVTQTKIVLSNRVKNENIFVIAPINPFLRDKSTFFIIQSTPAPIVDNPVAIMPPIPGI